MKGNYLITTDAWFIAPDGKNYKSVWGEVKLFDDNEILGIKTNAKATNWYALVGTSENHIIIAGCQIHYAVKCKEQPNAEYVNDYEVFEGKVKDYIRPSHIYLAIDPKNEDND